MGEIAPDAWLLAGEVLEQAQRVLAPYTLEVHETAWFSVYRVGHTVTDKFDDIPTTRWAHVRRASSSPGTGATPTPRRPVRA
jgi:hypothetical protein